MGDVIDFTIPNPPGFYSLWNLPQAAPVAERTYTSTWWELDEIFRMYLGQFVVVTGIAGSGKSTFLLNLLMNVAVDVGLRTFMYVPENETNLLDKAERLWCANPKRSKPGFKHFAEYQWFVQSSTEDGTEPRTIEWVLKRAYHAVTEFNCSAILIDPWNELERIKPRDMLLTDYIGQCIGALKDFCRKLNVIVIMVAHPTKAVGEHGGRLPTLADIEGSMNWFNKCDNGLVVDRSKAGNTCAVYSAKVREFGAGRLGVCHFNVDPQSGLFTPQYGGVSL